MAHNTFYNEFDMELVHPDEPRSQHVRTAFQQDRDRIIYTSSFRRLQAKTQVFFSGEYDFYRTRLTHSIEVAQIGRSICNYLKHESDFLDENCFIDSDLVEAICLAHDIGHPPFGHAGEATINQLMESYGGFEGNAQTLRIITESIYSGENGREGMNPTRAFVDGVMKYKKLYSEMKTDGRPPKNHFLYDEQQSYLSFIFSDSSVPALLKPQLNKFRSIECQIMDWADDTAYSLNDLVDGITSGLITIEKVEKWAQEKNLTGDRARNIADLAQAVKTRKLSRVFSRKIGEFIKACRLVEDHNFMSARTKRYAYRLDIQPEVREESDLYGAISRELVFWSPQIYQLEYKADYMIRKLFQSFAEHYLVNPDSNTVLLPSHTEKNVRAEKDIRKRARLICDYIAGMTDGFAVRTYKRLFDPDFGSIMDLI
ncbi:dNTP triphosphohydrolase [bacterium]|nr:dNTP triphosphohydrolase [bacterium]